MKVSHLAAALMVSLVVTLAGNLLFGPYGNDGYAELVSHRDRLAANVAELQQRRTELQARIELLRRSSDAVALEARRLQYYDEGDLVIRLENMPRPVQQSPGRVILGRSEPEFDRAIFRLAAVISGAAAFVVLTLGDRRRTRRSAIR